MNEDDKFLVFSRQLLDANLEELDESILSRLRQNRQQAVEKVTQENRQALLMFPGWLAPVSTGATFAAIALTVTLFWAHPLTQSNSSDHFIEDMNLLSVSEELEFYQNIEFYLWLEDEPTS